MSRADLLTRLSTLSEGDYDTDKMVWGSLRGGGWPLASYDEEYFQDARQQGEASARLTTDFTAVLAWFRHELADLKHTDLKLQVVAGRTTARIVGEYGDRTLMTEAIINSSQPDTAALALARCAIEMSGKLYDLQYGADAPTMG